MSSRGRNKSSRPPARRRPPRRRWVSSAPSHSSATPCTRTSQTIATRSSLAREARFCRRTPVPTRIAKLPRTLERTFMSSARLSMRMTKWRATLAALAAEGTELVGPQFPSSLTRKPPKSLHRSRNPRPAAMLSKSMDAATCSKIEIASRHVKRGLQRTASGFFYHTTSCIAAPPHLI